jgi:hypothetical protein
MTTMVEQSQHTNCGSISLDEILIDTYKNFGQKILKNIIYHIILKFY